MLDDRLFAAFGPIQVAAIAAAQAKDAESGLTARSQRTQTRHFQRRAKAKSTLADILPARIEPGHTWHVVSHGDIDSLSFLRHALTGVTHFDHVLISTWCIARPDLDEIAAWLDTGRIDQFDLYAGEIFPNQYGDEYERALQLADLYGCRVVIARNHSKVTLASNHAQAYHLAIESSANVNTNPRIEQTAITADADLVAFYRAFFHDLRSIDRHSRSLAS